MNSKKILLASMLGLAIPATALAMDDPHRVGERQYDTKEMKHDKNINDDKRDAVRRDAMDNDNVRTNDGERRNAGEVITDASLLAQVKTKFGASDTVDALDINVDVRTGIVYLNGTVGSKAEKQEAIRLAQEVSGVTKVDSSGLVMMKDEKSHNDTPYDRDGKRSDHDHHDHK